MNLILELTKEHWNISGEFLCNKRDQAAYLTLVSHHTPHHTSSDPNLKKSKPREIASASKKLTYLPLPLIQIFGGLQEVPHQHPKLKKDPEIFVTNKTMSWPRVTNSEEWQHPLVVG